jgi:hypothetical protein
VNEETGGVLTEWNEISWNAAGDFRNVINGSKIKRRHLGIF